MAVFLALYQGRTVAEAELISLSADHRLVSKFFEELAARPVEEDGRGNSRGRVTELRLGERKE